MSALAPSVLVVTPSGQSDGSGHHVRSMHLAALLRRSGYGVTFWPGDPDRPGFAAAPSGLVILDARDVDPAPWAALGQLVIALDNRHPRRREAHLRQMRWADLEDTLPVAGQVYYYDTIPHPDLDLRPVLARSLPGTLSIQAARPQNILVYAGLFRPPDFLAPLISGFSWPVEIYGQAGGGVRVKRHLSPADFRQRLRQARVVLTYFGQTMLEALQRPGPTVLFSVGQPYHDALSRDLSRRLGVPFVTDQSSARACVRVLRSYLRAGFCHTWPIQARPDGRGFERLVAFINTLLPLDPGPE